MLADIHQHAWTDPLLDALSERSCFPFVRRSDGLTTLHSAGERPYVINLHSESAAERSRRRHGDGIDLALVAISSPIGIEALEPEVAAELIETHLEGVLALGEGFAAWGPFPVRSPNPDTVDDLLARGCVGVSVPAGALAGPEALQRILPVLERAQSRGVPIFVHPGAPIATAGHEASLNEPLWWSALTDYVAQMQAAWLTFVAYGRRELPTLEIVFAMLAGGAPLHSERLVARGGPEIDLRDPLTFYDTSSYGPLAVEATARAVGPRQLAYGSDRPVIEPARTGREAELMANAGELLARIGAPA